MKRTIKIKANCSNKEDEILLIGEIQRNIKIMFGQDIVELVL